MDLTYIWVNYIPMESSTLTHLQHSTLKGYPGMLRYFRQGNEAPALAGHLR